jgi:hypothetical protein
MLLRAGTLLSLPLRVGLCWVVSTSASSTAAAPGLLQSRLASLRHLQRLQHQQQRHLLRKPQQHQRHLLYNQQHQMLHLVPQLWLLGLHRIL